MIDTMIKKADKSREARKFKFARRHMYVVSVLLALVAAITVFLFLHHQEINKEVNATNQATQKMISDADIQLKRIEERKAAEAKAK